MSVMKFCECVVRCLCVRVCREVYVGVLGKVQSCVVNFVECVVWWLMWVVFL